MRLTLVQPPSNRFDTSELAPPLGLVSVAAFLREYDIDVTIVDLNLEGLRDPALMGADFYRLAAERIAATAPDVAGFTSMALESHVCLELGRRLKLADPSVKIVLGGPHFSASAGPMLRFYDWVDFVVVGEGEQPTLDLLRALRDAKPLSGLSNVAYLEGGQLRLQRRLKMLPGLDDLPFPAYDLVDLDAYFELNPYRVLDIENARGCALRCAFCYSPTHWGQGEQARSVDRVLEDVHRHHELGARHLFFVGDNFLNSKTYATAVSDAIAGANPGLTWRCYATLAQLTEEVAESFARSQCKYLFIGVDAVSDRSKRAYGKSYFRGWPSLKETLDRCLHRGMTPTCAFMVNPPNDADAIADTEAAVAMATHVYNAHGGVRLNPLTVYARTGIDGAQKAHVTEYSSMKPRLLLDGHWVTQENPFAQEKPELYPYHSTVGSPQNYDGFIAATHTGFTLLDHFPRTLMQAAHAGASLWSLLWNTAARVDYSEGARATWRTQEAEAFAEEATRATRSREVQDTLTFELAENRLRRGQPGVAVKVEVAGTPLDVTLQPHAQLTLSRSPVVYETTEPPAEAAVVAVDGDSAEDSSTDHAYLLVPNGAGVRYLEPSTAVDGLLRKLQAAALDGTRVEVPAEGIATLVAANVVALPVQGTAGSAS